MVLFHADDFGLTKKITDDIIECIEKKAINSLSVIPNTDYFEYAMNKLEKHHKNVKISLHLNYCIGKALSPDLSLLTNDTGFFNKGFEGVFLYSFHPYKKIRQQLKNEIKKETILQIEKIMPYLKKWDLPLRIDSERNTHAIPTIWDVLMEINETYKIDYLRNVYTPIKDLIYLIRMRNLTNLSLVKIFILNFYFITYKRKLKLDKLNIDYPVYVYGVITHNNLDSIYLRKVEKIAQHKKKCVEIIFHPYEPCKEDFVFVKNNYLYSSFFKSLNKFKEKKTLISYMNDKN